MEEWINVKDKLPGKNKFVIVFANCITDSFVEMACYYVCPEYLTGNWCDDNGDPYGPIVTHWQPLPKKPA